MNQKPKKKVPEDRENIGEKILRWVRVSELVILRLLLFAAFLLGAYRIVQGM